jgi:putative transposase
LALISVEQQRSYPILVEQRQRTDEEKQAAAQAKAKKAAATPRETRGRGRPKGSQNKDLTQINWTAELRLIAQMVQRVLALVGNSLAVPYLVLDGHFGHNNAMQMVRQGTDLHLISKLRHDAALYLPAKARHGGRGRQPKYGAKLAYTQLPDPYRVRRTVEEGLQTDLYQVQVWHKAFAHALNGVILVKTNLATGAQAHVILFSSDLDLPADQMLLYYRLRFQIEFNFRDAKQFWGLEDFMTVKPTAVLNAATLALFMVNVAQALVDHLRLTQPHAGMIDLKAYFRGRAYAARTLKLLPQPPEPFLFAAILDQVARLGRIHSTQATSPAT